MELRCVTTKEKYRIYQNFENCSKICGGCHAKLPVSLEPKYGFIVPHHLVHKDSVQYEMTCVTCNTTMVNVKPADECRACTEEFQHADKERLEQGLGVPVVPTWIES